MIFKDFSDGFYLIIMSRSVEPTVMVSFRSKREASLLDAINLLRRQGISHYISLPQLIVCGDQSSSQMVFLGPAP
jgi:hypothetical protein